MHGHSQESTPRPDDEFFQGLEAEMFPEPTDTTREALAEAVIGLPEPALVVTDRYTRVSVPDKEGNKVTAMAQVRITENKERDTMDYRPRVDLEVWDSGRPYSAHTVTEELGEEIEPDPDWQIDDLVKRIASSDDLSAKWVTRAWALLGGPQDATLGLETEQLIEDRPPDGQTHNQQTFIGSYDFPNGTFVRARFTTEGEGSESGWVDPRESPSLTLLVVTVDNRMYHLLSDGGRERLNIVTLERSLAGQHDQDEITQHMRNTREGDKPTEDGMSNMAAALKAAVDSELVR